MKPDARELRALARRDPALGALLSKLPPFPNFPGPRRRRHRTHYVSLASAIVYQQLSGKAAETIFGRLCALTPGTDFPAPHEMRTLGDAALRGAGLSRAKVAALRDLGERIDDGRLELERIARKSDDEIIEHLTSVRGIGVWSAQMFLLFRLGRLDVIAEGDMGVQEGVRLLDGLSERPRPKDVLARAEVWRPLRSVGCWMMWRLVERERARAREMDTERERDRSRETSAPSERAEKRKKPKRSRH
jgi:3-methyladenine DNA glycosylase/8-oxoguanine DNA glycosylase